MTESWEGHLRTLECQSLLWASFSVRLIIYMYNLGRSERGEWTGEYLGARLPVPDGCTGLGYMALSPGPQEWRVPPPGQLVSSIPVRPCPSVEGQQASNLDLEVMIRES